MTHPDTPSVPEGRDTPSSRLVERLRARIIDCDCSPACAELLRQAADRLAAAEIICVKAEIELKRHSRIRVWTEVKDDIAAWRQLVEAGNR